MLTNSEWWSASSRRRAFAIAVAVTPLLLLLILAILNPAYLGSFLDPAIAHIGLPVLAVIVFLTAVAYPAAVLGSLAVFNSGRRILGGVLLILVFLFLCVPDLLLLLLSPAAFALTQYYSGKPVP